MSKSVSQDSASRLSVVIAPSRAVNQRERSKKGAEDAQRDVYEYLRRIHVDVAACPFCLVLFI